MKNKAKGRVFKRFRDGWLSDEKLFLVIDIAFQRNLFSILRDIWDQSWRNVMLIKTTYPNFLHGSDFFCFLKYDDQNQAITTINEICKLRMNPCKQNYANSRKEFSDVVPCAMI